MDSQSSFSQETTTAVSSFERLNQYGFSENNTFMQGWKKVRNVVSTDKLEESLLKAQVYFYSREVEPVDFDRYTEWLKENKKPILDNDILLKYKSEPSVPIQERSSVQKTELNSVRKNSSNSKETETQMDTDMKLGKHPENFLELVEMIQKGLTLPDTEDLNIEPLNEDPSPCERQRPNKPWEIT